MSLLNLHRPSLFIQTSFLQVGNGDLTVNEQRSHFALWALLKAPLMVGTDLAELPEESLKILLAKEVIAVNQDELGIAGDLIWKEGPAEVCFLSASHPHYKTCKRAWKRRENGLPSKALGVIDAFHI